MSFPLRTTCRALCVAATALLAATLAPSSARADAGSLGRGDVSMAFTTVYEPFDTYWYYYGPDSSQPYDVYRDPTLYDRFGLGNYEARDLGMKVNLFNVGARFEFGLRDNVSISAETQFVHGGNGEVGTTSIGDTRLGARFGLTRGNGIAASLLTSLKIPGLYDIQAAYSPGDGQPDLDVKLAVGGLGLRRRLFWDAGLGYRFRFPFADPTTFYFVVDDTGANPPPCLAENQDLCAGYEVYFPIDGPANETFMDATAGYFTSRRSMVFATLAGVDSHGGASWDDLSAAWAMGADGDQLFTELEEDFVRLGVGVLVKPRAGMTAFASYTYTVWGRNTAAFLRTESGVPIGALAAGFELTFGTRGDQNAAPYTSASLDPKEVLAMRFGNLVAGPR